MKTKIRHVLEPQRDIYAAYMFKGEPYGALVPVLYLCLVDRWEDESEPPKSAIVGYVINGEITPADETDKSRCRFLGYQNRNLVPPEQWADYLAEIQRWGRSWEAQERPVPQQIRRVWEEPEEMELPDGIGYDTGGTDSE